LVYEVNREKTLTEFKRSLDFGQGLENKLKQTLTEFKRSLDFGQGLENKLK